MADKRITLTMEQLRRMVKEVIMEQISGMGMGGSGVRRPGLGRNVQRTPANKQNFDWNEDLKKAKDKNTSMDELMQLLKHQNQNVAAAAKQTMANKLFAVGLSVK